MDTVLVSASGAPGPSGSQFYDRRDNPAPPGRIGEPGHSASAPSAGTNAGTISLRISPAPGGLRADGTGEWAGQRWDVADAHDLILCARGGAGGAGGRGEDGQHGGAGVDGADASQFQDATHGGPGERGGDAGEGTSGGDGGRGGTVEIEVSEHDTNLLLAVAWDVSGGAGGAVGTHGRAGEGGPGGVGGGGCSWQVHDGVGYACCGGGRVCTCKKYNQVTLYTTHARPPGAHGHQGFHGAPAAAALSPGAPGAAGAVAITVRSANGMASVYAGTYRLQVVSFEVADENGDMIMEPGEHVIVRNIRVQNSGCMPSPAHAKIPILIRPGDWLDPLGDEPAYLPTSIFPGETVSVRGEVRAFIRQEGAPRYPGVVFAVTEDLQLTATMPGIDRELPGFFQPTPIDIRYPLELEAPCTLRSVERGNSVTFSWRLWNVSSKPYGVNSLLRRSAATCLSEIGDAQAFSFPSDDAKSGCSQGIDTLDLLAPGTCTTISQTFRVSDRADQYSTGVLNLELLLSEPGDNAQRFSALESRHRPMRSILHFPISVQIAARYTHSADARFLLVVNAETAPSAIDQCVALIRGDLEQGVDIWNLSVYGNLLNPHTGACVLFEYIGRSIVIFANPFEYFGTGARSAFALLDPFAVAYLAAADTQFLFAETAAGDAAMGAWFAALVFPTYPRERGSADVERKVLIATLNCGQRDGRLSAHVYSVKPQLLKQPAALVAAEIKRTARLLGEYLPLHRFSVAPVPAGSKKLAGCVFVRQGLPRAARVVATVGRWDVYSGVLSNFNMYMIVALMPFKTRARMFWERVGGEILDPAADGSEPVRPLKMRKFSAAPVDAIELDSAALYPSPTGKSPEPGLIPPTRLEIEHKIYIAICLSITYEIELEVSRFCTDAPWPDVIPETNCLFQLAKLEYLVSLASSPSKQELPSEFELLVETLGCVVATTQPTGAGQFIGQKMIRYGNRQTHLRVQLLEKLDAALHAVYAEKVAAKLKRKILRACDKTKEDVARVPGGTLAGAILSRLSGFAGEHYTSVPFFDASTMKGQSEAWGETEAASRMAAHSDALGRIANDEAHSRAMLNEMMKIL